MKEKLTDEELQLLVAILKGAKELINNVKLYSDFSGDTLFYLTEKLGLDDLVYRY